MTSGDLLDTLAAARARAANVARALVDADAVGEAWAAEEAVTLLRRVTRTYIRKLMKDEERARKRGHSEAIVDRVESEIEFAKEVYVALGGSLDAIERDYDARAPE